VTGVLRVPRRAALAAITALVVAASAASFAESYRGLFDWAREHGLTGLWAAIWPLQADAFIAVGELALFVALADRWAARSRAGAWAVTLGGLAVSVAGNVGHVAGHSVTGRGTAAVPPLAAAAALAVGLGVLKRVVAQNASAVPAPAGPVPDAGPPYPDAAGTPDAAAPDPVPAETGGEASGAPGDVPEPPAGLNGHAAEAAEMFAADLAAGRVPSIRDIRTGLRVGQDKATEVQGWLRTLART
jgi:Protein of unknown function (DUF2637)